MFASCMVKKSATFIVLNDKGLHTRPSTEIVKCAMHFTSQVKLSYKDQQVNAKSLLGILMLAAGRGAKVKIEAEGIDAEKAVNALLQLAANKFYMQY
jgi:phosphocarrier protein HPr